MLPFGRRTGPDSLTQVALRVDSCSLWDPPRAIPNLEGQEPEPLTEQAAEVIDIHEPHLLHDGLDRMPSEEHKPTR
jgi:hypothetical protein